MTELLEQAIAQLKGQSIDRQDAIAALILEELEEERRWDESFGRSPKSQNLSCNGHKYNLTHHGRTRSNTHRTNSLPSS
jgi:hypothetical protein